MAKSDDGHYELVLGNRQLISGFFVLIILFAIFLTLGYVLGRNSVVVSESPAVASREAAPVDGPRSPVRAVTSVQDKPSATGDASAVQAGEAVPQPAAASASEAPAQNPSAVRSAAEPVRETPPAKASPEPAPARTPVAIPETQASRAQEILNARVRLITPRKGDTFLQVAAVSRAEAELMAEQLGKRGYRAHISEVPGKELFRVLIGPFETTPKLNETKAKLTGDGINSIVQRY